MPFVFSLLKDFYPLPAICKLPNGLTADTANPGEKLLSLYFFNIIRHYKASPLFKYMQKHLKKGDIFVDIGAYLGIYSYLACTLGAKPILVEANPVCVAFLQRNNLLFHDLYSFAAWNKEEKRDFFIGKDDNAGSSSLIESLKPWRSSCYKSKVKVHCRPIQSIISSPQLWGKIGLIKLDVEGAEDKVLEGFGGELGKHRFHIWCEVRDATSDRNPESYLKVHDLAEENGYSIYYFDGKEITSFEESHIKRVFDLLLIPN